ncbi:MAG TPA: hypothetical protein VFZ37_15175 [Jiangellaceae bacterium]
MHEGRPTDLTPERIGFDLKRPVAWLNPGVLLQTGAQVVTAYLFDRFLDKRELQAVFPSTVHDHSDHDELWLDYTADAGDGFDATYSIAYLIAANRLTVSGAPTELPRGDVLVLGGDQVYPAASATAYEDRWKGPYRAALPELSQDSPTIYAIPGNHDWYDGLTAFIRLFAQNDPIGGWRTAQNRSYFALQLPQRWWMFALDIQLDAYIDEPQLEYFRTIRDSVGPDDRIILAVARPAWTMLDTFPAAYDSIDYFVRTVINRDGDGPSIPLILAGDKHHYSRYAQQRGDVHPRTLVTCGGAGAYLSDTAALPDEVTVPSPETHSRHSTEPRRFTKAQTYPTGSEAHRLSWQVFWRLPWRNRGFVAMLGFLQTMLMLALLSVDGWGFNAQVGFAVAAILIGTVAFAVLMGHRGLRNWVAGILHAVPHFFLGVGGTAVWMALPFVDTPPVFALLLALVLYLPVIGLLDTWVLCAYLIVARLFGVNDNEIFAGMGIDDYKSFLRMHIAADGTLTIYPIAVDDVARRWRANPNAPAHAPWIVPADAQAPAPRLAEPPIVIKPE